MDLDRWSDFRRLADEFDVAVPTSPVSWLRTVIVAPGSAAWLESTTWPLTVARNSWAVAALAKTASSAMHNKL